MVLPRSPIMIPWECRWDLEPRSTAGAVAAEGAVAALPAWAPRREGRTQVVALRVVLGPAGFADLRAAAERLVQVEQQRRVVPPAVPLPEVVLPLRAAAAAARPARPLPADVQLPTT